MKIYNQLRGIPLQQSEKALCTAHLIQASLSYKVNPYFRNVIPILPSNIKHFDNILSNMFGHDVILQIKHNNFRSTKYLIDIAL